MRREILALAILLFVICWSACGVKGPPLPPEHRDISSAAGSSASDLAPDRSR